MDTKYKIQIKYEKDQIKREHAVKYKDKRQYRLEHPLQCKIKLIRALWPKNIQYIPSQIKYQEEEATPSYRSITFDKYHLIVETHGIERRNMSD